MNDFTSGFFVGNRQRLAAALPNALILIAANSQMQESADLAFPFRQDSNFWYLTGLNEPDLVLAVNTTSTESSLLLPEQNAYQKEWDGKTDTKEIESTSGISIICDRLNLSQMMLDAKKRGLRICYLAPLPEVVEPYGFYSNPARRLVEAEIKTVEAEPKDIRMDIARLRQIKQPAELKALQKAIDITAQTLEDVKHRLTSFKSEKELERAISAGFFMHGSDGHGYEPIVGNGKNAAILHYGKNSGMLHKNSLILLDVGALSSGYSADISRVWAFGEPTARQKSVFEAVCRLQDKAFSILGPGVKIREYQKEMEKQAFKALKKLDVTLDRYPHGFSHFLGLDTHDAGDYEAPLKPNSVITVEPGIYLPEEGTGVRIEDNILITENGIKNLSTHIPRVL